MIRRLFFELRYLLRNAPWDTGITPPEVMAFLESHPAGRAVDLGCGTGTNAITLARHGWQVTGVDFAAQAVSRARRKARRAGLHITFLHGDVAEMPGVEGPFDLALDIGCFHSLSVERRSHYAAQLARVLRPGASYLLYSFLGPEPAGPDGWPTEASIRRSFGETFQIDSVIQGADGWRASAWFTLNRKG
jgi:cyclopropane fatty-acyl-phospholipid synthase-like methyltransferase